MSEIRSICICKTNETLRLCNSVQLIFKTKSLHVFHVYNVLIFLHNKDNIRRIKQSILAYS
jgi:hypothetical protein